VTYKAITTTYIIHFVLILLANLALFPPVVTVLRGFNETTARQDHDRAEDRSGA